MANYIVSSSDTSYELIESDEIKSVLQNVALILNTRKGTVPMFRDFGLKQEFLDKPIEVAETIAYTEITEAIEEYEPRAEVVDISLAKSSNGLKIIVEVDIK